MILRVIELLLHITKGNEVTCLFVFCWMIFNTSGNYSKSGR